MNEIRNILQSMATNFAQLADEIERRDQQQYDEIAYLQSKVNKNKETLRKVANVIMNELEG